MPGLNVELAGTLFEIIELPGIVDPGSGRSHMPGKGNGIGTDRPDALRQVIVGGGNPIELPVELPAQKFLGDELGIVAVAATVEVAEDHLPAIQRSMNKKIPADFHHQPVCPQVKGQKQFLYHN